MSLQSYFVPFAFVLALAVGMIAVIIRRIAKNGDFFTITLFGNTYTFRNPLKEDSYGLVAPHIRPINDFLKDFVDSREKKIEFTPDDIKSNSSAHPILRALQGMDYERVRLRLRIISSLNPTVNFKTEEGIIPFTCGLSSGGPQQVKLRSQFAPKGQSILLEKL